MTDKTNKRKILRLIGESFVPILLVLFALIVMVIYVQFQADISADQATIIDVGSSTSDSMVSDIDSPNTNQQFDIDSSFSPEIAQAKLLIENGNWAAAEKLYLTALKEKKSARLHTELSRIYLQQGKIDKAKIEIDTATQLTPIYPASWFYRGIIMNHLGNKTAAKKDYTKLLSLIPHHYEAQMNLALIYLRENAYQKAISLLASLAGQVGGSRESKAQFFLGITYIRQNKNDNKKLAIKAFTRAIRLKPDYIDARIQLSLLENDTSSRDGYEAALKQFKKIIELKPNNASSHFYIAKLHADHDKTSEAIRAYRKAVQYNPGYRIARKNLGLLLLKNKQWGQASEQFIWLSNNYPNDASSHFFLGRISYGQRHYDEAISHYNVALKLTNNDYPEAHLNLGLAYNKKGDSASALEQYMKALRNRASYPQAWYNIGLTHMRNNEYKQAKAAFNKAITQDKKYEQAWFNLALIHTRENSSDLAIKAYETALTIRPNYRSAALNLAVRYTDINQLEKAISLYNHVLLDDPAYTSAWINLGIIYSKLDQDERSENALQQAVQLEPDNIKARKQLARTLTRLERYDDAEAILRVAIEIDMANVALRRDLAQTLIKAGEKTSAITELEAALRLDPTNKRVKRDLKKLKRQN